MSRVSHNINGQLCIKLDNLQNTLYRSFNLAQNCQINLSLLDEISDKEIYLQALFSKEELKCTINKCNNSSAPRPDKLLWRYIKMIIKNYNYSSKIIDITNACINLRVQLFHFKMSTTVIILKPNKLVYDSSKVFYLIVLLNILGKLIKKMIDERLQFHLLFNNFIHSCQLDRLKQ